MKLNVGREATPVCSLLFLALVAGCGGEKGLNREAISGSVTREGQAVDKGAITFFPASGGPATSTSIVNGKYQFDKQNGPVAGKQKVTIVQDPIRAEADPNTPPKDREIIPDTRFKKKMPPRGWQQEADLNVGHKNAVDFHVDE